MGACYVFGCNNPNPVGAIGEVKLVGGRTVYYDSDGDLDPQAERHINLLNPFRQRLIGPHQYGLVAPTLIIISTAPEVSRQVLDYATESNVNVYLYHPELNPNGSWTLVGNALNPLTLITTDGSVWSIPNWLISNPLYNGLDAFTAQPSCP